MEGPDDSDQVNLTDEESRIMPVSGGGFDQAFNAQAAADQDTHILVFNDVTQQTNDKQQVGPVLQWFEAHPQYRPIVLIGDAGYYSEANVNACIDHTVAPIFSPNRQKHNTPLKKKLSSLLPPSDDATAAEHMQYRMYLEENRVRQT